MSKNISTDDRYDVNDDFEEDRVNEISDICCHDLDTEVSRVLSDASTEQIPEENLRSSIDIDQYRDNDELQYLLNRKQEMNDELQSLLRKQQLELNNAFEKLIEEITYNKQTRGDNNCTNASTLNSDEAHGNVDNCTGRVNLKSKAEDRKKLGRLARRRESIQAQDETQQDLDQGDTEPQQLLPLDTFSFFACLNCFSLGIFVAGLVSSVQAITISFLMLNILAAGKNNIPPNFLNIPPKLPNSMLILQFLAISLTALGQNDVRASLDVLYFGYNRDLMEHHFASSSHFKWILSSFVRFSIGVLNIFATFMLIVTENNARDLLLNFTAMEFISYLDDVVFLLCKWGYFGKYLKYDAVLVQSATFTRIKPNQIWARSLCRTLGLVSIWVSCIGWWVIIVLKQMKGGYLCPNIYVQFGDEILPDLGVFSGMYAIDYKKIIDNRVVYVEQRDLTLFEKAKPATFTFCTEEESWLFNYDDDSEHSPTKDKCEWKAKSDSVDVSNSESYDIMLSNSHWYARNKRDIEIPLQHFSMKCIYCSSDVDCGGAERGICTKNHACHCNEGYFGNFCDLEVICKSVVVDENFGIFRGNRLLADKYAPMKDDNGAMIKAYGRPVFSSSNQTTATDDSEDMILYTGRRWILTSSDAISVDNFSGRNISLKKFISTYFHAYWSKYSAYFMSEPVDVDTPKNILEPVNIRWYHASIKKEEGYIQTTALEKDSSFICATCSSENLCAYGNRCINETCHCSDGSYGSLCHIPPLQDGVCNTEFNVYQYDYDGGDCCHSCFEKSKSKNCGAKIEIKFGHTFLQNIGYPNCAEPLCEDDQRECWLQNVNLIPLEKAPHDVFGLTLDMNRNLDAIITYDEKIYSIWKKQGSDWDYDTILDVSSFCHHSDPLAKLSQVSSQVLVFAHERCFDDSFHKSLLFKIDINTLSNEQITLDHAQVIGMNMSPDGTIGAVYFGQSSPIKFYALKMSKYFYEINLCRNINTKQVAFSFHGFPIAIQKDQNDTCAQILKINDSFDNLDCLNYTAYEVCVQSNSSLKKLQISPDGGTLGLLSKKVSDSTWNVELFRWNVEKHTWDKNEIFKPNHFRIESLDFSETGQELALFCVKQEGTKEILIYKFRTQNNTWANYLPDLPINDDSQSLYLSSDLQHVAFSTPFEQEVGKFGGVNFRERFGTSFNTMNKLVKITIVLNLSLKMDLFTMKLSCGENILMNTPASDSQLWKDSQEEFFYVTESQHCVLEINHKYHEKITKEKTLFTYQVYFDEKKNQNLILQSGEYQVMHDSSKSTSIGFYAQSPSVRNVVPISIVQLAYSLQCRKLETNHLIVSHQSIESETNQTFFIEHESYCIFSIDKTYTDFYTIFKGTQVEQNTKDNVICNDATTPLREGKFCYFSLSDKDDIKCHADFNNQIAKVLG